MYEAFVARLLTPLAVAAAAVSAAVSATTIPTDAVSATVSTATLRSAAKPAARIPTDVVRIGGHVARILLGTAPVLARRLGAHLDRVL